MPPGLSSLRHNNFTLFWTPFKLSQTTNFWQASSKTRTLTSLDPPITSAPPLLPTTHLPTITVTDPENMVLSQASPTLMYTPDVDIASPCLCSMKKRDCQTYSWDRHVASWADQGDKHRCLQWSYRPLPAQGQAIIGHGPSAMGQQRSYHCYENICRSVPINTEKDW